MLPLLTYFENKFIDVDSGAVTRFWWSSNGYKRGMHWLAWHKLCRKKRDGGLDFRTLDDFNTALLAKQLWRLINAPHSLFARVFKGRYYRKSGPLDPVKFSFPSYGWNSIMPARSLVQRGMIKRIGDGKTTSVWTDPWFPTPIARPPSGIGQTFYPELTVDQLIDGESKSWNLPLLNQLLDPNDLNLVKQIHLPRSTRPDIFGWNFTKTGKYTVKSGYDSEYANNSLVNNNFFVGPSCSSLQAHCWKIQCPPKIRHFLWQALSGCLSVSANLYGRGINCDDTCFRCGAPNETILHVLFECPPALQTWALSRTPSASHHFPRSALFTNFDYLFWRLKNVLDDGAFPWILCYLWKARNDKLFNNINRSPQDILSIAEQEAKDWANAQLEEVPPNFDISTISGYKCFIDGSWKNSDSFFGMGWFCMQDGVAESSFEARPERQSLSPLHSEMKALLWAMTCMLRQACLSVTFLTDSTDLVKMTSTPSEWPAYSVFLEKFVTLKTRFSSICLCHVMRSSNQQADVLARSARESAYDVIYVNQVPPVWQLEPNT